jgi:indolepyruvate decarboxylase
MSNHTAPGKSIGDYLIERLLALGVNDIFGIPGDFVLGFYGLLEASPIRIIGTCNELNAGYAADAYARMNGVGAVCVTYNVGGLSLVNAVAGAYSEKSPLIVISGAPGVTERLGNPLLHHRVGPFTTQRDIFEKVTVAAVILDDVETAFREIDRCLDLAITHRRPVYIELPRDRVDCVPVNPYTRTSARRTSDAGALEEALNEAVDLLAKARQPVILAGLEIHRCGMGESMIAFAERHQIPICSTILSKSVVSERHPLYLGVYEGAMSSEHVRQYVEDSDCLIILGAFMTDMELGIYTANLKPERWIFASIEELRIRHHHFLKVEFADFLAGLVSAKFKTTARTLPRMADRQNPPYVPERGAKITNRRLFQNLNAILDANMVVVCDVGDALFGAVDLVTYRETQFLGPAYYTSMGFATPAAVAVQVANRALRPIVLVGDGAFQMTGHELSTAARYKFNPVVLLMNNRGYTTERFISEGDFNDVYEWQYHRLPELFGTGLGLEVRTEGELADALVAALANTDSFSILNIHLDQLDVSPALARLTSGLKERV